MRTEHPNASCNVERPVVSLRTVIIAVGAAQFMLPFMLSGAGPLLPAIGRDLHASAMQLSLINAAYTLSLAIFHLVAGRVGDMVGRKRLFLSGLLLFVVMSALLPFVTNIWLFLCCRFVQAMGTAIMNTCALAILVSCAPPEQLGRVLGLTSIGVYSGLSLGPGLSGLLGTALGWQFLFFSVVPIGIIAWLLMYCNVRCDWKDAPDDPFDWRGSLFYTLAVSLLSIGAIWLFSGAWAGVLFALGVVFLGLFLWEERRSHHPILDVAFLVKNKAFALSTLASFINYSSIFGVTFYFSLYLQGVHGLTLLETGLLLSAQPAVQVFISPLGGRMADRHGAGIIAMLACIFVVRYVRRWGFLIKVVMLGAAALLALPLAIGTEQLDQHRRYQRAAQRAGEAGAASDLELVHVTQAIFAMVRVRGVFAPGADAAAGPWHGADLLCHHAVPLLRLHRQPAADLYPCPQ